MEEIVVGVEEVVIDGLVLWFLLQNFKVFGKVGVEFFRLKGDVVVQGVYQVNLLVLA